MTSKTPPPPISRTEYARHRGVSLEMIRKYDARGLLDGAIVLVGRRRMIGDVALADRLLDERLRPKIDSRQRPTPDRSESPPVPAGAPSAAPDDAPDVVESYVEARARRERALASLAEAQAGLAELERGQRAGELGSVEAMRADVVRVYTETRNKLLAIPSKLAQRCPGISHRDLRILDDIVREGLEALADGRSPLWADDELDRDRDE